MPPLVVTDNFGNSRVISLDKGEERFGVTFWRLRKALWHVPIQFDIFEPVQGFFHQISVAGIHIKGINYYVRSKET